MLEDCATGVKTKIDADIAATTISSGITVPFQSEITWCPRQDVSSLRELSILVVPAFRDTEFGSRGKDTYFFNPVVMVSQVVDPYDVPACNELALLVEELEDSLKHYSFTEGGFEFHWVGQDAADLARETLVGEQVFWVGFSPRYRVDA